MRDYEELSSAYLEHYLAELKTSYSKRLHPEVFYESHNDYAPQDMDYRQIAEYYMDLRDCVNAHPKLIYLLLAAVCPLFQDQDAPCVMFYFHSDDADLDLFISHLISSMYGNIPDSCGRVDFTKIYSTSHKNKAYYLNRIPHNFISVYDDIHFLHDTHHSDYDDIYYIDADYPDSTESLFNKEYCGNSLIRTFSKTDEFFRYYDNTFGYRMYFNTDLLSDNNKSDSGKYSSLKKFILNCNTKGYHHVFNPYNQNFRQTSIIHHNFTPTFSESFNKFITNHEHLSPLVLAIFKAAAFLNEKLDITISTNVLEQVIERNFDFSIGTFLSYTINNNLNESFTLVKTEKHPPQPLTSTRLYKKTFYEVDPDTSFDHELGFYPCESPKIFHNEDKLDVESDKYQKKLWRFINKYIETHNLYDDFRVKKLLDSSWNLITPDDLLSDDIFDVDEFDEDEYTCLHILAINTYDIDITYGLEDIFS